MSEVKESVTISKSAMKMFLQLLECAELVHHSGVSRSDVMEKLAAQDRELVNQCHEDVTRILTSYKEVKNG